MTNDELQLLLLGGTNNYARNAAASLDSNGNFVPTDTAYVDDLRSSLAYPGKKVVELGAGGTNRLINNLGQYTFSNPAQAQTAVKQAVGGMPITSYGPIPAGSGFSNHTMPGAVAPTGRVTGGGTAIGSPTPSTPLGTGGFGSGTGTTGTFGAPQRADDMWNANADAYRNYRLAHALKSWR